MKHTAPLLLGTLLLAVAGTLLSQAQVTPVDLDNSGFTYDAIVEANGSFNGDLSGDAFGTSYVLVTNGYAAAHPDDFDSTASALPNDGMILSPSTVTVQQQPYNVVFQLQPYDEANVLFLSNGTGMLTLAPTAQASYSEISFLVANLSPDKRSSSVTFELNYLNGPSIFLPTANPVANLSSAPSTDAEAAITMDSYFRDGAPQSPPDPISLSEYDFSVSAPINEILQSITIDPGSDELDVFAVSGVDPTPEPPTSLLLLTSLGGLAFLACRTRVRA